jgi:hemolysin D
MSSAFPTSSRQPILRRRTDTLTEVVGAFESETAAVFLRVAPASEHVTLYLIGLMVLISFLLMAAVKLDRVVTSTGRIVPVSGSLYISPFDTSIVREVRVKAGEVVHKGQVLASLDPTFTHADLTQLQQKLASGEAAAARLEAEQREVAYRFDPADPYQSLQASIWEKRQAEFKSDLTDFDARIRNIDAQIAQSHADMSHYQNRLKLADNVEKLYEPLLAKGLVTQLQFMQAADERTEMGRLLSDAQSQIAASEQSLSSLQAQREAFIQKWHSDIGTELVNVHNGLDLTRENLSKAQKLSDLSTLNAPANAVVLSVGKVSSGSVAGGGSTPSQSQEPLFTLVPLDAVVEADVRVNAEDIGFIKAGDPVRLKLDAYRFMQHGTAAGVIKAISEGSFTVDDNNVPVAPYFKVRVGIKDVSLRNVPADFRLIPGMTLTGDIMVGKRTILSYVVEGAVRTGSEGMREPQ